MQAQRKKQKQAIGKPNPMDYTARLDAELQSLTPAEQDQIALEVAGLLREQKVWEGSRSEDVGKRT